MHNMTYRESLRDIEACLLAQAAKPYHMGIRESVDRSTLADANELPGCRIWESFAERLIVQVRELYLCGDSELGLTSTGYALDPTTIDLCLSVFWLLIKRLESDRFVWPKCSVGQIQQ